MYSAFLQSFTKDLIKNKIVIINIANSFHFDFLWANVHKKTQFSYYKYLKISKAGLPTIPKVAHPFPLVQFDFFIHIDTVHCQL